MSELSYLEKLLDGAEVEWIKLSDLVDLRRGRVMSKGYFVDNIGRYPVYSSQTANNGMIGSIDTFDFDGEFVSWTTDGANAGTVFYRTGKFSITNVCGLIKINDSSPLNYKYLFYWLTIEAKSHVYSGMGNPKLMSHQVEKIPVPIPCPNNPEKSLAIQSEIVRILDKFTALTAELTAELTARKKQYSYYRDQLLSFEDVRAPYLEKLLDGAEVEWRKLSDLVDLRRGRVMSKGYLVDNIGRYPVYSSQTANNGMIGSIDTFDFDGEFVSWTTDGANAGTVFYRTGKFSITNVCGLIKINDSSPLNYKYLFYWLTIEAKSHVYSGMGNPKLMSHQVEKIPVPIPCPGDPEKSLAIQSEIVRILDKFDTLTSSISEGLPREIELRQKQYEYYRDLLFSFPKPESVTN